MDALRYVEMANDAFIEGWLVPFGGSFDGKDSYGTFATRNTDFCLDWFAPDARPLLYHHGRDPEVGPVPIGRMCGLEVREHGVWMQAQLDKRNAYFEEIKQLVRDGQLGLSSGAMAHLVDIDERTGEWKRWPIVEGTTTPAESNLLATIDLHTFKSHVRAAGIDLPPDALERLGDEDDPAVRAVWSTAYVNDLPDSCFAYVEPGDKEDGKTKPLSKRHLPFKGKDLKPDASHVRNALARLDQTDISAAAKAAARKKLMAAARTLGIAVSDDGDSGRSAGLHFDLTPTQLASGSGTYIIPAQGQQIDWTLGPAVGGTGGTPCTSPIRQADDGDQDEGDEPAGYDGSYEDLISDLRDLLNPSTPFSQAGYSAIIATYPDHVLCSRWDGYADGDSDEPTYWSVAYSLGDDGEPMLGTATQVEQTYVPVASSRSSPGPLTLDAHHLTLHAGALAQRTQDLSDRRIREGRVLSAHNRRLLADAHGRMGEAHAALGDLLAATDRQGDEAARATQWGDPAYRRQQFALLDLFASTVD